MERNDELVSYLRELLEWAEQGKITQIVAALRADHGVMICGVYAPDGEMAELFLELDDLIAKGTGAPGKPLRMESILDDGQRIDLLSTLRKQCGRN